MRRKARNLCAALALTPALAAALPALAEEAAARTPPPADAASCLAPAPGEPSPARTQADLAAVSARLAAEARQAGGEGARPLNTRGYNYDAGTPDSAAIGFEARGR